MVDQNAKKQMITTNQKTVANLLDQMKGQIALALPKHMNVDRVTRIALTEFRKNPKLQECDPMTFIACIMEAAQLGLEPGILGSSYLVPYWNSKKNCYDCTLIPGYRGFIDLARRSGNIQTITAEIVYENDEFEFEKGLEPKLVHKPVLVNSGKMIAAYAVAQIKGGGFQYIVMSKEAIDQAKNRSKSSKNGPWVTDYEAMAQKTVVRRLFKWLPVSIEMQKAAVLDEHAENNMQDIKEAASEDFDIDFNVIEGDVVDTETGEVKEDKKSQVDEIAERIKA